MIKLLHYCLQSFDCPSSLHSVTIVMMYPNVMEVTFLGITMRGDTHTEITQ